MKLNLGCGHRKMAGYVNVDRFAGCAPDECVDLDALPWPWPDDSVEAVAMSHVLEHLGATTEAYLGIVRELYRVSRDGAEVTIAVPHPRHDDFINDPTHVRAVTVESLLLFSKSSCDDFLAQGAANTPLAHMLGVDFEVVDLKFILEEPWLSQVREGKLSDPELQQVARQYNNVIKETAIRLRVKKE